MKTGLSRGTATGLVLRITVDGDLAPRKNTSSGATVLEGADLPARSDTTSPAIRELSELNAELIRLDNNGFNARNQSRVRSTAGNNSRKTTNFFNLELMAVRFSE